MLIFPLSHESGEVQRLPYLTLSIIILNILLYIVTYFAVPATQEEFIAQEAKLSKYYAKNPYLNLPKETFRKLSPSEQKWERQQEPEEFIQEAEERLAGLGSDVVSAKPDEPAEVPDEEEIKARQKKLDRYAREFEDAYEGIFYRRYGYIPARGGFFTLFSSMFLNDGLMHLLFNMFFLYLSGCKIEDLWGRIAYPIFYLIGGIVASLSHGLMFPESVVPCVGASGAIAAVMGAFMIRLYKTKIYFFYIYAFSTKVRRGTFQAPAYLMLPLWLTEQILESLKSAGGEGGVAFWSHIGGFVFGAIVAFLFKFSGFEEKVIAPAIEKKVNLVDENFSSGMKMLQEGDPDGAAEYLRKAVESDPENAIAHSELSKIYCGQGKKKEAVLELRRAVNLYLKQGNTDNAVDDYLEISSTFPDMVLNPLEQVKLIEAIEEREKYPQAATAWKNLFVHCQRDPETKDGPEAVNALSQYGDICLKRLEQPKAAFNAYKMLLQSCRYLTSEQKKQLESKAREAMNAAREKAEAAQKKAKDVKLKQKNKEVKLKQKREETAPEIQKPKSDIPLKKKIRVVEEIKPPWKYEVTSVTPYKANKVRAVSGGMNLSIPSTKPVLFHDIYLICVFEFEQNPDAIVYADVFVPGKSHPYRIPSNRVVYSEFLPSHDLSSFNNFREFILWIMSYADSVYLDRETMTFLKTRRPRIFPSQYETETHEKNLWKQLIGEKRFLCGKCREAYWIDGRKIPEKGARTKCKKCGHPIFVRRPE